jgi:signal transduction histidine kinase
MSSNQFAEPPGHLLTLLTDLALQLNPLIDVDELLSVALDQVLSGLGLDYGVIWLFDTATGDLVLRAQRHLPEPVKETLGRLDPKASLAGEVTRVGRVFVFDETTTDPHVHVEWLRRMNLHTFAIIPLCSRDRVIGAMSAAGRQCVTFDPPIVRLLEAVGVQIGLAVERAWLLEAAHQNAGLYTHVEELVILYERNRIAREIHDGLLQNLAVILARIDQVAMLVGDNPVVQAALNELAETVQAAMREGRRIIFAWRPVDLARTGFAVAVRQYATDFSTEYQLGVTVSIPDPWTPLPAPMESTLLRIVQEALNNVRKHAQASHVWIECHQPVPERVVLRVRDDGRGFESVDGMGWQPARGLGLTMMRERLEALGGRLTVNSSVGRGTEIVAEFP